MFASVGSRSGRARTRAGPGMRIERGGVFYSTAGLNAGDIITTFDDTPFADELVELDGSTITNGANDFPLVAARYPSMVSGADLVFPDLRGTFLRHRDNGRGLDQDRAGRSAGFIGGLTGDNPTTFEYDGLEPHYHQYLRPALIAYHDGGGSTQYSNTPNTLNTSGTYGTNLATGENRPHNIGVVFWIFMGA